MYTPKTTTYVDAQVANGLSVVPNVPDLESQFSSGLANDLKQAQQFAAYGRPTTKAGIHAGYGSMAATLLGAYPNLANGKDPVALVDAITDACMAQLAVTPLDPLGIRDAGMVSDHLGAIAFVNGQPVLTQFPLVQRAPVPVLPPTKSPLGAPMQVFLAPNGQLVPGFLAVGWLGVEWIGGPGLPANWQDLPSAVALGLS